MANPIPIPSGFVVKNGSKIWLQFVFVDTCPVILNGDLHRVTDGTRPQSELPRRRPFHGLCTIDQEIQNHLLKFDRVTSNGWQLAAKF